MLLKSRKNEEGGTIRKWKGGLYMKIGGDGWKKISGERANMIFQLKGLESMLRQITAPETLHMIGNVRNALLLSQYLLTSPAVDAAGVKRTMKTAERSVEQAKRMIRKYGYLMKKGENSRRFKVASKFRDRAVKKLASGDVEGARREHKKMSRYLIRVSPKFLDRAGRMMKKKRKKDASERA